MNEEVMPKKPKRVSLSKGFSDVKEDLGKTIWFMVLVFILEAISVTIACLSPRVLMDLTDEIGKIVVSEIDLDVVTRSGIILAIFYVVNATCQYFASFTMTTLSQMYARRLRTRIQNKINRLPLRYFDSHAFGDILSRITNDVDSVSNALNNAISTFVHAVMLLLGTMIAMFIVSWQMALACVATLPILIILMMLDLRIATPEWKRRHHLLGEIEGVAEEQYSGQNVIKLFEAENESIAIFEETNQKLNKSMFRSDAITSILRPLSSFVSYLAYAATAVTGGLLMYHNMGVTIGVITGFFVYVNNFQSPISELGDAINTLNSGLTADKRIQEFLAQEEEIQDNDKPNRFIDENGKINLKGEVIFDHVNFGYDKDRQIIFDFSETVKPGQKVAIVGPTGAGKTTMVNLLMRFYETDSGDIKIDGVSTKDMSRREIHQIFGMVLQDTWLFEGTLRENLIYNTPNVTEEKLQEAIKACHLRHYISTLPGGLDYMFTDANNVSAGEKQLITICRAYIRSSPLLILDEATSNVDTMTEFRVQRAIDHLTEGRTTFVIAHRLSTIRNADLILVMKDGNIVEHGNHETLMEKNGFYASLYNAQFTTGSFE